MARPRKVPSERHTSKITVAVTDDLKAEFERACAAAGVSPSEYVRRCVLSLIDQQQGCNGNTGPSDSMQMVS